MQRLLSQLKPLAAAVLLAACAGGMQAPASGVGAPAPAAAVDRFLQLAGEGDYLQMGWYFGTSDGAVLQRDPASDVEKRMYALATVMTNDGYVVGTGESVPGRIGAAQRFRVRLQREGRQIDVPIVTVRTGNERWLVEQVDVEAITNAR